MRRYTVQMFVLDALGLMFMLAIALAVSYFFASAGDPRAVWFWTYIMGMKP